MITVRANNKLSIGFRIIFEVSVLVSRLSGRIELKTERHDEYLSYLSWLKTKIDVAEQIIVNKIIQIAANPSIADTRFSKIREKQLCRGVCGPNRVSGDNKTPPRHNCFFRMLENDSFEIVLIFMNTTCSKRLESEISLGEKWINPMKIESPGSIDGIVYQNQP